jgi:hypothetical protein
VCRVIIYRPSGKAEGRGQKAEGKKKVFKDCLCALPKPGLRPPPNFQFGGLRKDMGLNPLIFTPSAFCLRTSAFLQYFYPINHEQINY